jgi:hypothetical protein
VQQQALMQLGCENGDVRVMLRVEERSTRWRGEDQHVTGRVECAGCG